jgi:dTDP-4-amino-4,6-dideoxygalactose transaminase
VAIARSEECSCSGRAVGGTNISSDALIWLPATLPPNEHIWNQYTLRVAQPNGRDRLREFLASRAIGSEIYYPVPLHRQECFSTVTREMQLPVAEQLAAECLSIPIFPELTCAQQDSVIGTIGEFTQN